MADTRRGRLIATFQSNPRFGPLSGISATRRVEQALRLGLLDPALANTLLHDGEATMTEEEATTLLRRTGDDDVAEETVLLTCGGWWSGRQQKQPRSNRKRERDEDDEF